MKLNRFMGIVLLYNDSYDYGFVIHSYLKKKKNAIVEMTIGSVDSTSHVVDCGKNL